MGNLYKVQNRFLFHSNIKIKIPDRYEEKIFDEFFSVLEEVNRKYNSYSKNSFIDKINKNAGNFVEVDNETVEMLEKIKYFSDILGGEYDITVMPLIRLWGFYKKNLKSVPDENEIQKTKELVNYRKIEIDKKNNRVKISAGQEIITGSFIKSYAIDKLADLMRRKGITDAVVNAGGSSILSINDKGNEDNGGNQSLGIIIENPLPYREIEKNDKGYAVKITDNIYKGSNTMIYLI